MTDPRPVILIVDDSQASYNALFSRIREFDGGRLDREFQFAFLQTWPDLRNWYVKNRGSFVSLIVQDVDYSQLPDKRQIVKTPKAWQSAPEFDEVGLQGIIIYDLLRNERVDATVPVLFVSSQIGMHRSREFAEYIVNPGFGTCAFVPEDATGDRYYPEIIRFIDELALRPLTEDQRDDWRETHGMIVGRSRQMAYLCYEIDRIAPSDSIVLLLGEPGVGKELVAKALHRKSSRFDPHDPSRARPLTVNIAALEKTLVEDELFGHLKGAYTDAGTGRPGIFEAAQGSTVFLDEIGDLSKEVQLKLLRVMEYHEIKKLGTSLEMQVDNRIIAATNRTPQELLKNSRTDFIGRLVQNCIIVPGLGRRWEGEADRVIEEDIRELVEHFLAGMNAKLPAETRLVMTDVSIRFVVQSVQEYIAGSNQIFTNNVRTIKNVVERSFERAQSQHKTEVTLGEIISTLGMIKLIQREVKSVEPATSIEQVVGSLNLEAIERRAIEEAYRKTSNQADIARLLGVHRDTVRKRLEKYGFVEESGPGEGKAPG